MTDIDRQIAIAKKKPPTSENLNYIGDLYLKNDDKQQALAYFYEAADKLHFAQKEKKIAIYKKILKISPVSEKAYIGIIEILSKMGLVMEEKKFLHMLAQLYESRGESGKAAALLSKIRELDPHVIPDGTFFHREAHQEVMASAGSSDERGSTEKDSEINKIQMNGKATADAPAMDMQVEKLIEATLEEILPEKYYPAMGPSKRPLRLWYLLGGGMVLFAFVAGVLFYFLAGNRGRSVAPMPVNTRINDYEITFTGLDDLTELSGVIDKRDMGNTDFYILTVRNQIHCVPDAFATFPHNMISLLDKKGGATLSKPVTGLQKTTRTIAKMNVCDRDNAIVFVRTIVAVDRQKRYYGLAISGLQNTGPLSITWD
jgi:hypothetical protein